jgi:hypothetical protein
MYNTDFFYCNIFETESGTNRYDTSMSLIESKNIPRIIETNYKQNFICSLDDIFAGYTTYSGYVGPVVDFSIGSGEIDSEPSGDTRPDLSVYSYRNTVNVGLVPTFDDELPETVDVYGNETSVRLRSVGLKAPIMMAGFGYDTEGLPVPSEYDRKIVDSGVTFYDTPETSGLMFNDQNIFCEDYRVRKDLHVSGPFDARFDKRRGMWVAAPEFICGYAAEDIPAAPGYKAFLETADRSGDARKNSYSSGLMDVAFGSYNDFKFTKNGTYQVLVINRSNSNEIASGTYMVCARVNNSEVQPIWTDCDPDV